MQQTDKITSAHLLKILFVWMCLLTALAVQEKVSGPWVRHQRKRLRTAPKLPQGISPEVHNLPSPFWTFVWQSLSLVHQVLQYKKKCEDLEGDYSELKTRYDSVRLVRLFVWQSRDVETSLHVTLCCHSSFFCSVHLKKLITFLALFCLFCSLSLSTRF